MTNYLCVGHILWCPFALPGILAQTSNSTKILCESCMIRSMDRSRLNRSRDSIESNRRLRNGSPSSAVRSMHKVEAKGLVKIASSDISHLCSKMWGICRSLLVELTQGRELIVSLLDSCLLCCQMVQSHDLLLFHIFHILEETALALSGKHTHKRPSVN
jgi:hypothetical protein